MFNSQPIQVFPFSCLVSTLQVILSRLLAVTPPNLGYLVNGLLRVRWHFYSAARTAWVRIPPGSNFFRVSMRKYFFTNCIAMLSSTDAKLMGLMKPIIAQNAVVKLSYPTGVGSNPARSQYLPMYISAFFLYR